ncbi:MAG: VOC family protein [Pseudomonadota bacterium]|nr:VOC family protein [Pseudomonadota bacterium]
MIIKGMGYLGVTVPDIAQWEDYGTRLVGAEVAEKSDDTLKLRIDDHYSRINVHKADKPGIAYTGWDVGTVESLNEARGVLDDLGIAYHEASRDECAQRNVLGMLKLKDPGDNPTELFYGHTCGLKFKPSRDMGGFVTGELGLGHILYLTPNFDAIMTFYHRLGFRLSDSIHMTALQGYAYFLHCNRRQHSLALGAAPHNAVGHLMLELESMTDVGKAYDIAKYDKLNITMTMGQHTNDRVISFYTQTPSGFDLEIGAGGLVIDDLDNWTVAQYQDISFWGHHGGLRNRPSPN